MKRTLFYTSVVLFVVAHSAQAITDPNSEFVTDQNSLPALESPIAEPNHIAPSAADAERVAVDIRWKSLKRWIKRRENKDVEIVDAQSIHDIKDKPASINVMVTSRLDRKLTLEQLKKQLSANVARERELRHQLRQSFRDGDISAVNRIVGEITEIRTAFVNTNEVTSYKLSFCKDNPPVLSFWSGLPFEMVREEAARSLAVSKLGEEVEFDSLVHYTAVTSLLCFRGKTGAIVYIDPFRLVEVPIEVLQYPKSKRRSRDDEDKRKDRISKQWAEFLLPETDLKK